MSFQVEIGFNAAALAAISELTQAIRSIGKAAAITSVTIADDKGELAAALAGKQATGNETPADDKPSETIYWLDNKAGEVGTVESEDKFKALKKKNPNVVKTTESKYKAKLAEIEAAANAQQEESTGDEPPSVQDVIDAFSSYLPADLDADERAERAAFVKPLLQRFGAKKATELAEEHRKLAINLVKRKMAGEDIDPTSGKFAEICDEDESLV